MEKTFENFCPLIIGGTGGSGTRVVAEVLMLSEQVYLGRNHNIAFDCLDFKPLYDLWIPKLLSTLYSEQGKVSTPPSFNADFKGCLYTFLEQATEADLNSVWGWKGPRSMYLLPFIHHLLPKLRFLHIVRDGRDMALSRNQNQLTLYGASSLGLESHNEPHSLQSIALWEKVNMIVSQYAISNMPDSYLCIKYEDLVFDQDETLCRISNFIDIDENYLLNNKNIIMPSPSIGRWRRQNDQERERIINKGLQGLTYFGYDKID